MFEVWLQRADPCPVPLQKELAERLRYRCQDVIKAVTKNAVRKARKLELETEIINSEKLKVGRPPATMLASNPLPDRAWLLGSL